MVGPDIDSILFIWFFWFFLFYIVCDFKSVTSAFAPWTHAFALHIHGQLSLNRFVERWRTLKFRCQVSRAVGQTTSNAAVLLCSVGFEIRRKRWRVHHWNGRNFSHIHEDSEAELLETSHHQHHSDVFLRHKATWWDGFSVDMYFHVQASLTVNSPHLLQSPDYI